MEATCKQFRKRNAILSCLRGTDTHPSAEWIHDRLRDECPDISLATVYRNLALFKQQGIISSLGTVDGVERFDGNTAPHVHFVCTGCSTIRDLHGLQTPDALCAQVQSETGAIVTGCSLTFTGTCQDCQKSNATH